MVCRGGDLYGYTIFDAIAGAPGTFFNLTPTGPSWGFSISAWQAYWASQVEYTYKFVGVSNPSVQEQQKELAALKLGEMTCAGQSPDAIAGCIQDAYNTMQNPTASAPNGGNWDFPLAGIDIQGQPFDPSQLGCFMERCGAFDTLDFSHNDGTFHVDTANPWFFPIGSLAHLAVDVVLGNTVWSNGIPR